LIERSDGLIGLEERIAGDRWSEQVDNTLREQWQQRQILSSLGASDDWLRFPADDQTARVSECVNETTPALLLARSQDDNNSQFSGWTLSCAREHDHGAERARAIWELTESFPFLTQFLALPVPMSVTTDAPSGAASSDAVRFSVRAYGLEFLAESESYLDGLNYQAGQTTIDTVGPLRMMESST
jgi:hypothetical protein